MVEARRRRTDHFVLIDVFLIMAAAVLVFLVYREISNGPAIHASQSAQLIYRTTGAEFTRQPETGAKEHNVEVNFLQQWKSGVRQTLQGNSSNVQIDLYSPLERFSKFSSNVSAFKKTTYALFKSGRRDTVEKTIARENGLVAVIHGPVYATSDCFDCAELGLPEYRRGDLIAMREVSFPVANHFVKVIQMLLGALAIMATMLCITSVFLLPMIRKSDEDNKTISLRAAAAEEQAITDPLTLLHNRRYFEQALNGYIQEFGRLRRSFGLMVLDLDHFKQVNDTYGHDCGDMVLREVALRLKAVSREHDVIARIGGEEFAIITPFDDKKKLTIIAERFRSNIEDLKINVKNNVILRPTVSIGVATSSPDMKSIHDLFQSADKKLYKAKNAGRNRVAA